MAAENMKVESFFRIVTPPMIANDKMMIPRLFVQYHGSQLCNTVTFVVPDGRVWYFGLTREEELIYVDEGFKEFMEYYSLGSHDFLLFEYKGRAEFHVNIYDRTCTEIKYPNTVETLIGCAIYRRPNVEVSNVFNDDGGNAGPATGASLSNITAREATSQERQKAVEAARSFKSDFPSFTVVLKGYSVKHSFMMCMPRNFPNENASLKKRKYFKLEDSNGQQWKVRCIKDRGKARIFGRGWPAIVKEKELKAGDVCVFELIRTNDATMKLSVFRARENS